MTVPSLAGSAYLFFNSSAAWYVFSQSLQVKRTQSSQILLQKVRYLPRLWVLFCFFVGVIGDKSSVLTEPKVSSLVGLTETPEKLGPLDDEKTLQELRSLGRLLKVLHHQVRVWAIQDSEWVQVGFIIDRLLFGLYILFILVSVITIICFWVNSLNTS